MCIVLYRSTVGGVVINFHSYAQHDWMYCLNARNIHIMFLRFDLYDVPERRCYVNEAKAQQSWEPCLGTLPTSRHTIWLFFEPTPPKKQRSYFWGSPSKPFRCPSVFDAAAWFLSSDVGGKVQCSGLTRFHEQVFFRLNRSKLCFRVHWVWSLWRHWQMFTFYRACLDKCYKDVPNIHKDWADFWQCTGVFGAIFLSFILT